MQQKRNCKYRRSDWQHTQWIQLQVQLACCRLHRSSSAFVVFCSSIKTFFYCRFEPFLKSAEQTPRRKEKQERNSCREFCSSNRQIFASFLNNERSRKIISHVWICDALGSFHESFKILNASLQLPKSNHSPGRVD